MNSRFYTFVQSGTTREDYAYAQITEQEYVSSGFKSYSIDDIIWENPIVLEIDLVPLYEGVVSEKQFRHFIGFRSDVLRKTVSTNPLNRIVSVELKTFLEQFILSPHGFYPVKLRHDLTNEVRDYFLWHTFNIVTKEVIYPVSEFELVTKRTKELIKTYGKGTFENEDQYKGQLHDELYERKNLLRPVKLYYSQPYDVLSAGVNMIVISEKVKQAMEEAFPSMEFHEFTDYQIITGYQA
ncbi:hypothetical protein [Xanthocytophaga flava]|uniref:hypothetical protein n=1 Tax=Xanthocytophaga flava TaxID=3048013 RepID=UPI0028D349BC|nr:hypothetical protein [Xanthocytophaga flavus]MDJ1470981.1 hypothetical protein [Xanthocytophaga flavus]